MLSGGHLDLRDIDVLVLEVLDDRLAVLYQERGLLDDEPADDRKVAAEAADQGKALTPPVRVLLKLSISPTA